jgi:hypothetical protein
MNDRAEALAPWWEGVEEGARIELGFVKLDRVGSTADWETLPPAQVIARRAEYQQMVEAFARSFQAIEPLHWQGDGVMLFVRREGDPRAWSRAPITSAAMHAGVLAVTLQGELLSARFPVRVGVHAGDVAFSADTGKLASPEIDRAGHLEHDAPRGAVALSEDVFLALPSDLRGQCAYLGTTARDGTVAFVFPASAASHRDAARFLPAEEDLEPRRLRFLRYVDAPDVRRLRYVGFRLARKEPPSLDLLEVFTPLSVVEKKPEPARAVLEAVLGAKPGGRKKSGRWPEELAPWRRFDAAGEAPQKLEDVLRSRRHVLILGEPGSGKSTLLRWIAVTAAGGRARSRVALGIDERLTPILAPVGRLFELRDALARRPTAGAGGPSVVDALVEHFHERNAAEDRAAIGALLRRELEAGRALTLLDGLDEVPTERRREATSWIEGFAAMYRESRLVATSRIVGFTGLDLADRAVVTLEPFSPADVRAYVVAWTRAYRVWENLSREAAELDRPVADREAERLLGVLQADERLSGLARNPLLLSTMALVHRAEGALPAHRVQLYDLLARALCETWSQARRIATGTAATAPRIDFEAEAIPVLGRLALWLHENHGTGAAPEAEVRREIAAALEEERGVPAEEAERSAAEMLRLVGDDRQILVPRGPGLFGFLHLTFEEFFAAAYLHAKERFEEEAERRWFDPRWEEVLLLGTGMIAILQKRSVAAGALIERALTKWEVPGFPFVTEVLRKNVLFAARMCADAPNVPAAVEEKVAEAILEVRLRSRYKVVRANALRALKRMRGSSLGATVARRLAEVAGQEGFGQEKDGYRVRVLRSLGATGDERAFEPLVAVLQSDGSPVLRAGAARALTDLGDPRAVDALMAALGQSDDPKVRMRVADALGTSVEESLLWVRRALTKASDLEWRGADRIVFTTQDVPALTRSLDEERVAVCEAAAEALWDLSERLPELQSPASPSSTTATPAKKASHKAGKAVLRTRPAKKATARGGRRP